MIWTPVIKSTGYNLSQGVAETLSLKLVKCGIVSRTYGQSHAPEWTGLRAQSKGSQLNLLQISQEGTGIRWHPTLLGVGITFAAFLMVSSNLSPLLASDANGWLVTVGCFGGIILASLICLPGKKALLSFFALHERAVFFAASLFGCVLVVVGALIGLDAPLLAGFAVGAGFFAVMANWCALYAAYKPEEALLSAALSLGASGVLFPMVFLPMVREIPLVVAAVLLLVSAALQIPAFKQAKASSTGIFVLSMSTAEPGKEAREGRHLFLRLRDRALVLWKPLLSAIIACFIIGLVHNPDVSESAEELAVVSHPLIMTGAPLLVAVLALVALFFLRRVFTLHLFCNVVMPVAVALLLVVPMLSLDIPGFQAVLTMLSQCSFAVIALATWTSVAESARITESSPWTVFAVAAIGMAAALLVGIATVHVIGKGGQALSLLLLTVFLLLMVLDFALRDRARGSNRELQQAVFKRFLLKRCEELATNHRLTTRENEVLSYLARGYSHVYIAKELYVSENTIRTHVRHIYTKLDVNSREDLFQLIDAGEEGYL
jgi:DNA-binding CsgD family transcriptional regulator